MKRWKPMTPEMKADFVISRMKATVTVLTRERTVRYIQAHGITKKSMAVIRGIILDTH